MTKQVADSAILFQPSDAMLHTCPNSCMFPVEQMPCKVGSRISPWRDEGINTWIAFVCQNVQTLWEVLVQFQSQASTEIDHCHCYDPIKNPD